MNRRYIKQIHLKKNTVVDLPSSWKLSTILGVIDDESGNLSVQLNPKVLKICRLTSTVAS
jgi:hypothetical protein